MKSTRHWAIVFSLALVLIIATACNAGNNGDSGGSNNNMNGNMNGMDH